MKLQSPIFGSILGLAFGIPSANINDGIVYSRTKDPALEQTQRSLQAKFSPTPN
jgi:hypothetical protein